MAAPIEFLPFAWHLFKNGRAESFLTEMETNPMSTCPLFKSLIQEQEKGFCSQYPWRALVCRLFGFAAMVNKHGQPELSTCRLIKESQKEAFEITSSQIKEGKWSVPIYKNYYSKLAAIDTNSPLQLVPIKQAVSKAIEMVLWDNYFRQPQTGS